MPAARAGRDFERAVRPCKKLLCTKCNASGGGDPGVVYKLDATGHQTVLNSFGGTDGSYPAAGVIRDSAGNLYGTTAEGGGGDCYLGCGVVYELNASGQEVVLYRFTGGADGGAPEAGLVRDSSGNLYGTTVNGGSSICNGGCGVVYKLDATGHETVLHSFTATDGFYPNGGMIRDSAGNLYGTTSGGGKWSSGELSRIRHGYQRWDRVSGVVLQSAGGRGESHQRSQKRCGTPG